MAGENQQQQTTAPGTIESELDLDFSDLGGESDGGDDTVSGEGKDDAEAGDEAGEDDEKGDGAGEDDGKEGDDAGKDGDDAGDGEGKDQAAQDAITSDGAAKTDADRTATDSQQQLTPEQQQQQAEAQRKSAEAFRKWEQDFTTIEAKLEKGEFHEIDDLPVAMKVFTQGFKYVRQAIEHVTAQTTAQVQTQSVESFWKTWDRDNADIGAVRGQQILAEEIRKAKEKGYAGETAEAVATERWKDRIEAIRNGKKGGADKDGGAAGKAGATAAGASGNAKAKAAAPPAKTITKGGGRVTPAGGSGAARPALKPKTTTEKLESGEYGDLASII